MNNRNKFIANDHYKRVCRNFLQTEEFEAWVAAATESTGHFSLPGFHSLPHVQDRIDGGKVALLMFVKALRELPYKEIPEEESEQNSFVEPTEALDFSLL